MPGGGNADGSSGGGGHVILSVGLRNLQAASRVSRNCGGKLSNVLLRTTGSDSGWPGPQQSARVPVRG